MEELKREVFISAAFDKRSADPKKNYGIHGVNLKFMLSGEKGAIQFVIYTNWFLPHVQKEIDHRPVDNMFPHLLCHPQPADVGYHSPVPVYEGQEEMDCCYLPNGKCYYDGSGLQAEEVFNIMVAGGGDAMWAELERRYNNLPEVK
jgi:hypothetical protein